MHRHCRRSSLAVLIALTMGLTACSEGTPEGSTSAPTKDGVTPCTPPNPMVARGKALPMLDLERSAAPVIAPEIATLLKAAGGDAAVVMAIRPKAWPALRDRLLPVLEALTLPSFVMGIVREAPDPLTAITSFIDEEAPPGWDRRRPMLFALAQVDDTDPTLVGLEAHVAPRSVDGLSGLRHRLVLPASDPMALTGALARLARDHFRVENPAMVDGLPGAHAFPTEHGVFAVIPGDGLVRLELVTGDARAPTPGPQRVAYFRRMLISTPGSKLPRTPALQRLANGQEALALHVRLWRLKSLALWLGTSDWLERLRAVELPSSAVEALKPLAHTDYMMSPEGAEIDDVTFAIGGQGALSLAAVWGLSEHGQGLLEAARRQAVQPLGATSSGSRRLKSDPARATPIVTLGLGIDLQALVGTASVPPSVDGLDVDVVWNRLDACGNFCWLHMGMRHPLGSIKTALELATEAVASIVSLEIGDELPRSLSLVARRTKTVEVAFSASYPVSVSDRFFRQVLAVVDASTDQELRYDRQRWMSTERRLVGLGVDPSTALGDGSSPTLASGVLGRLNVDLAALAESGLINLKGLGLAPLLKSWTRPRLVAELSGGGRSLALELSLQDEASKLRGPMLPDRFAYDWESPGLTEAMSPGGRCLSALKANLLLRSGDEAASTSRRQDLAGAIACAMSDPATKDRARALQLALTLRQALAMQDDLRLDDAEQAFDGLCANGEGLESACRSLATVRALPRIALPSALASSCGGQVTLRWPLIRVAPSTVYVRSEKVAEGQLPGRLQGSEFTGDFRLLADPSSRYQRVADVLRAIPDLPGRSVGVMMRQGAQELRQLDMRLYEEPLGQTQTPFAGWLAMRKGRLSALSAVSPERLGQSIQTAASCELSAACVRELIETLNATEARPAYLWVADEHAWRDVLTVVGQACKAVVLEGPRPGAGAKGGQR